MISDEPDEDADTLDDEDLLENYSGDDDPESETGAENTQDVLDWPQSHRASDAAPKIDAGTLAWFTANTPAWQEEMGLVLRAWVASHTRSEPDILTPDPEMKPPDQPDRQGELAPRCPPDVSARCALTVTGRCTGCPRAGAGMTDGLHPTPRLHERLEHFVDPGLVTAAKAAEETEYIRVQAQADG